MPALPRPLRDLWLSRLVSRSQRGDRLAFQELYRALYGPVSRYVRRRLPHRADAEDVEGQVFFRLLETLDRVDAGRRTVVPYVLSMARRAVVDHVRARHGQLPEEEAAAVPDSAAGALDQLEAATTAARVKEALATLGAGARELLELRYGDALGYGEMASMLGITEAAARQRTSRAIRELRARLGVEPQKGALAHDG